VEYGIAEVANRTGVTEGTLRAWEQRHGFPVPTRLPGGHRRYSERDLELVRRVVLERAGGATLAAAIERAEREAAIPESSIFASLRRRHPDLHARTLPKRMISALTHAIEDECLARAEQPLLFASFQRERFYREEEPRWLELARGAALTMVFADFPRLSRAPENLVEVPVEPTHPIAREWAVVCDAPSYAVCLAAREALSGPLAAPRPRRFEAIWTVEASAVRDAARTCAAIATDAAPELADTMRWRLDSHSDRPAGEQLRLATAITGRTLESLA
jgi:DICT domain-containing protein